MNQIIVTGAYGRMGKRIIECIKEDQELALAGAVERPDHPQFGETIGEIEVNAKLEDIIESADAVIDYTTPEATIQYAEIAAEHGKAFVSGVTGLNAKQMQQLKQASAKIPLVYSPNMSVGINLLFRLVADVARILTDGYDVEIVETHHKFKKDAPSGTAKRLAEIIAATHDLDPNECFEYGRQGFTGEREAGKIGIHAVRGGDVIGEHHVNFLGMGERIVLTHHAHSRDTFVMGTLCAVKFAIGRKAGLYTMNDVLVK